MKTFLKNFIADESGASAAEYALIIAVVGVGIGAAALFLGANVQEAIVGAGDDVRNCNAAGFGDVNTDTFEDTACGGTEGDAGGA